ncbi:AAA family ATPase [Alkalinema pantanalense CENA528]|uniref:AAA family ATPase n=1 Tax=Alkalinema pantanalense TaxID=1620705 RepID=UPI003D6FCB57
MTRRITASPPLAAGFPASPQLLANGLLATLQVLTWLFLRPSAWQFYVAQIHPSLQLRSNFCLAQLPPEARRHPKLRRLCWLEFVILPAMIGLLLAIVLGFLGEPGRNLMFGVAVGVSACVGSGLIGAMVISVAASWMAALVGGLVAGIIYGLLGPDSIVGFSTGLGANPENFRYVVGAMLPPILMANLPNGVAASIAINVDVKTTAERSIGRQLGGMLLGLLGSALVLALVGGAVRYLLPWLLWWQLPGLMAPGLKTIVNRLTLGVILGGLFGILLGRQTRQSCRNLPFSILAGLVFAITTHHAYGSSFPGILGLAIGSGNAVLLSMLFALAYNLTAAIADIQTGAITGALAISAIHTVFVSVMSGYPLWQPLLLSILCLGAGLTLSQWFPVFLYPLEQVWNQLLYRLDERQFTDLSMNERSVKAATLQRDYLRWHSVFWDEQQILPLWGLDRHLVLRMTALPQSTQPAIAHISTGYQRWAAREAQIELDARRLEQCQDMVAIAQLHQQWSIGESPDEVTQLLRGFRRLSQDAQAVLNQASLYNQRLLLSHLLEQLESFARELTRSQTSTAPRFRPILQTWLTVVETYQATIAQQSAISQEIESPYIVGIPLTQQQEIFVGRQDVSAQIERLLREQRYTSLLLYGQRRMGKTSLLNHLGRLLPTQIVPLFVDLQGPASIARHHSGFLYNLAKGMIQSAQQYRQIALPPLPREVLEADPFTVFDEWLDSVEHRIAPATALLMLDEFEALNQALVAGRFEVPAILGMLRNLVQHRSQFRVLLAGTHTLETFQQWSSYLINLQVIHLSYLHRSAAQQLVEQPVRNFSLRYAPEATERILQLTRGHPFLIQLMCSEVIALKNEQPLVDRGWVTLADVEAAIPQALTHGSFFFADIAQNQIAPDAATWLSQLAVQTSASALGTSEPILSSALGDRLVKQELLELTPKGYQFQVELIRHWFVAYRDNF